MKLSKTDIQDFKNTAFHKTFKDYLLFNIEEVKLSLLLCNDLIELKKLQAQAETFKKIYDTIK